MATQKLNSKALREAIVSPLNRPIAKDDVAISVARVMTIANERARELGVDAGQSRVTIFQHDKKGLLWRINYGPKDYIMRRGGDLIIEVTENDLKVKRVLRGQ